MQRNFLILEDNSPQREMLSAYVKNISSDIRVFATDDVSQAYRFAQEQTMDCFMVDIILNVEKKGDTSGVRFVQSIRQMSKYYNTPVLFITSLEDPSSYAYRELHCFDYIEKPFDQKRIKANVEKILQIPVVRESEKTLVFRKDGILYPIPCEDILYIQCVHHVVQIHLKNQTVFEAQYRTCQEILDEADSRTLFQCNRNTIVNQQYVYNVDLVNRFITLMNQNEKISIGGTYKKKVAELFEND
ncbi:MAG: LytTR family DNA-binding domain-containing protein [Eubacteriales bacterium]|nr:LytTR family DNA-binding domain-containing protein [Eubacteriales bacterium]